MTVDLQHRSFMPPQLGHPLLGIFIKCLGLVTENVQLFPDKQQQIIWRESYSTLKAGVSTSCILELYEGRRATRCVCVCGREKGDKMGGRQV